MRINKLVGGFVFSAYIAYCLFFDDLQGTVRVATHLGFLALIAWYFIWGRRIDGWIGTSYTEMKERLATLDFYVQNRTYRNGQAVDDTEMAKFLAERDKLAAKMSSHPDHQDKRPRY